MMVLTFIAQNRCGSCVGGEERGPKKDVGEAVCSLYWEEVTPFFQQQ